jgi:hypothetical protein
VNTPDPTPVEEWESSGPIDAPQDLKGCVLSVFRCGGCMAILYIIMFIAVISAALLSLVFFH